MLKLDGAAAVEGPHVAIGGEAEGIPKADGGLDTELALEGAERRVGVESPVTPGRASQTILQENMVDCFFVLMLALLAATHRFPGRPCP